MIEVEEDVQFSVGEFFNGAVVVQDDGCVPQSGRNQLVVHYQGDETTKMCLENHARD